MDASETAKLVAELRLFQQVTDEEPLQQLFDEHRGRGNESVLTFPQMVQLIGDVLLEAGAVGRSQLRRRKPTLVRIPRNSSAIGAN